MYNTDWQQHAWSVFAQSIATGEPGLRLHTGKDLWEYLREHPNEQEQFQRVMSLICHLAEGPILRSYDFSSFERVVDVAGGRGTLLLFERVIMPGPGGAYNTFFDLEVLALLEGQERTPYEYERLLAASGFRLLAVKPTPSSFSIVESIPL